MRLPVRKQGQTEIMGLIVITIIAGLVIAFAIAFLAANAGNKELMHERFSEQGLSANFVTVLGKTYVEECNADFETIVRDCVANFDNETNSLDQGRIVCLSGGESKKSCLLVNSTAFDVIETTLGKWGFNYNFLIEKQHMDKPIIQHKQGCEQYAEREAPGRQIVPLYPLPENAYIILEICKG